MSFEPSFTVTHAITAALTRIERARGFLEAATLPEDWIREMSARALILEAHHTTHIEGTRLTLEESEVLLAGEAVPEADPDDVRELLNYRDAFEFVSTWLGSGGPVREGLVREVHNRLVEGVQSGPSGRVEPRGGRRDMEVLDQVGTERSLEGGAAGEGHRGHGAAVVGLGRGDDAPSPVIPAVHVVLAGQTESGLVGLGTAAQEADLGHLRGDLHQTSRQLFLGTVGEVVGVVVGDVAHGGLRGVWDLAHPVTETGRHRPAGDGVEDAPTSGGVQPHALAPVDTRIGPIEELGEDTGGGGVDGHPAIPRSRSGHDRSSLRPGRARPAMSSA